MKRLLFLLIFCLVLSIASSHQLYAQCAACKETAESSLKEDGQKQAAGLNFGIMYLLVIPYMLVGGIGYYWYVNNRKKSQDDAIE